MTTGTVSPIQSFFEPVLPALEQVKRSLLEHVPPQTQVLADTVSQSLKSGGKYLRPVVTLLAGGATGRLDDRMVEVAAVAEMIHIATLLHDDVLDESELRRGKQTIRAQFGNKISVLSGDYLLAQASLKLAKLGNTRLVAIYAGVLSDLCDGEVEQMQGSYSLEVAWESYFRKTVGKTASLFAAGCESAGVVNQLPEEHIQALAQYGKNFGIAFQIVDDLLDYTSSQAEMGKPVFDDLRNGLLNAPILLALESDALTLAEREDFRQRIQAIFKEAPDEAVQSVHGYLEKTQAIAKTQALTEQYIQQALDALAFVPDGREKQALIDIARYVIRRRH